MTSSNTSSSTGSSTGSKGKKRGSGFLTLLVVVIVLAGGAWGLMQLGESEGEGALLVKGAPVERGPLRISVVERGNLKAADSVTLKCEIEGRTTVLWLIEEGTNVEPGDLLVELDISELEDRRVGQEIQVQNAEATLVKAQQNHAIQISQNESDIANAERNLDFSRIDLEKYLEGDLPQLSQSKDEDILLADEELTRATQDYTWSEQLATRGFLEQAQLDADKLAKTRAEVKLNQANRAKELFVNYEIPRTTKELEAAVEEKVRELERVTLQSKAKIADYEADLRTAEAKFDLEKDDLAKILSQIDKAKIHAPVEGMVVYAVDNRSRWGDGDPMQEGTEVRERQDIITIPSSQGFVAEASLHESVLEKVQTGMGCLVTVDALQESFPGEVTFKAVLPDQGSWFSNPDLRVYRTEIRLLASDARVRPGMSCSIEILVDELQDATYVPVQAIFLDAGKPVCLVSTGAETPEIRPVEVGQNNGKWVQVISGVAEGETVLLSVPAGLTLQPATDESSNSEWQGPARNEGAKGGEGGGGGNTMSQPAGGEGSKSGTDWKKKAEEWKSRGGEGGGGRPGGSPGGSGKGEKGGGAPLKETAQAGPDDGAASSPAQTGTTTGTPEVKQAAPAASQGESL